MGRRRNRPEDQIQRAVLAHLRARGAPGLFAFHVPNGGKRRPIEAAIMKGLGVVAGVPDLIIIHKGKVFGPEIKTEEGKATEVQRATMEAMRRAGAECDVCYGLNATLKWLEGHGLLLGRVA